MGAHEDVDVTQTTDAVHVSLRDRTLRWTRGPDLILETPVAVGAPSSPTPPGTYFMTDAISTTGPYGEAYGPAYGPWILALNGFSDTTRSSVTATFASRSTAPTTPPASARRSRTAVCGCRTISSLGWPKTSHRARR